MSHAGFMFETIQRWFDGSLFLIVRYLLLVSTLYDVSRVCYILFDTFA